MPPSTTVDHKPSRGEQFLTNVFWNWISVGVSVITALFFSPYIIRKLGADGYGVWTLTFSVIGYYGLADLGFRSAVVYYTARFKSLGDEDAINDLLNTLLFFFSGLALILLTLTVLFSRYAIRWFHIPAGFENDFNFLVLIVGLSFSLGCVFNVFSGFTEGYQRFDSINQLRVVVFLLRYSGWMTVLALGFGLRQMGIIAFFGQLSLYAGFVYITKRMFPAFHLARKHIKPELIAPAARYGTHSFSGAIATMGLEQGPSVIIGTILPAAFVGYFNFPQRLLEYTVDAISRVGIVVAPQTAELAAKGETRSIAELAIAANRYCFTLFLPLSLMLWIYGGDIIARWVGRPEFSQHAAPLLPLMLIRAAFGMAGQFCSSTVLSGLARHKYYSWGLFVEAVLSCAAIAFLLPGYGLIGAAAASAVFTIAVRGIYTPIILCANINYPFWRFMEAIYARPLLAAIPVTAVLFALRGFVHSPGWPVLIALSAFTAGTYFLIAWFVCLEPNHRNILLSWFGRRWARLRTA
jgi:O-antigen/teichoic acid export membrane protein